MVPLAGVEVALGLQWLQTLGTYSTNHREHFIKFKWHGERHKCTQMEKLIRKGAPAYIVQCHEMELLTSKLIKSRQSEIQELIHRYKKVFEDIPM